eukprot:11199292-Lingulodinium_polyedra.AAC.1
MVGPGDGPDDAQISRWRSPCRRRWARRFCGAAVLRPGLAWRPGPSAGSVCDGRGSSGCRGAKNAGARVACGPQ